MIARNMPSYRPLPMKTLGRPLATQLRVWLINSRAYEITENFFYHHKQTNQTLCCPAGFRTDFASTPRALWPIGLDPQGILLIPSIFHDWGYRHNFLLNEKGEKTWMGAGRKFFDILLRDICEDVNGMTAPAVLAYGAVRTFGSLAWEANAKYRNGSIQLQGMFRD